eukprot:m.63098 g.63098  ORF g.63098 m.63098 type:complete len:292 (+) comp35144_c0_seq1:4300-5175(+)
MALFTRLQRVCVLPRLFSARFTSNASDSSKEIRLDLLEGERAGIGVIAINRPQTRNAIGRQFVSQLENILNFIRFENKVRVVIIKSDVEGVFCAGADLKERATMRPEEVGPAVSKMRSILGNLANLPQPLIAAVDGIAVGGGLELALTCDFRTASESSKMGLVETKLAIIPGGGGTQRLPRLIGLSRSKDLMFTGRLVGGKEALEIGLVERMAKAPLSAYDAALALATEILPQGPIALKMAKLAINHGIQMDLTSGLQFEEACYAQVIPTKDRLEGLKAFKEKRKPIYQGE